MITKPMIAKPVIAKNAPTRRSSELSPVKAEESQLEALIDAAIAGAGRTPHSRKGKQRSTNDEERLILKGLMREALAEMLDETGRHEKSEPAAGASPAKDHTARPSIDTVLASVKGREIDLLESFLSVLRDGAMRDAIEDSKTFADILNYAIDRGLVRQTPLAERLSYATSQVGRWAADKAAPPMIVRRAVIDEMAAMIEENLGELRRAQSRSTGLKRAAGAKP